jgi:glycine/D-amino acid oxidase-like deaminating enzyme
VTSGASASLPGRRPPDRADIVVVGGGIAGAAAAYELARRGAGRIVLLEQESLAGTHASGRNAALLLQNVDDESNVRLGMAGQAFYAAPPDDLGLAEPLYHAVGSLLLASGPTGRKRAERGTVRVRALGLDVTLLSPAEAAARVPILDPTRFTAAAWCPTDGVIDIHGALQALLAAARRLGATILEATRATRLETERDRVVAVHAGAERIATGLVVLAAGAWAGPLGASVGAPLPLRPTRRHLIVTTPWPAVDRHWPFVWDVDTPFYFRPESGGLLLCPCDIEEAAGGDESVRPARVAEAAAKAARLIPGAAHLDVAHAWAGIRTLTPDDRFVIGADPRVPGLFWLAGLGGHGMTAGPAAGRLAADLVTTGTTPLCDPVAVAPGRFLG